MDPNIITEESGVPEERQLGTATGTAYLRQLRKHAAESPVLPSETNAVIPAETVTDRRQSRRHQCTGSVRLRAEGSDVRLWGTLKDISLNGCYVETVTTFPVNTQVNVELESAGIRVLARATVRASYPSLGMGMCFSKLAPTQQLRVKEILAASAGKRAILSPEWRSR
ncbi:MAG: PilZ domain-containing protein [Terriglobales bacterium]